MAQTQPHTPQKATRPGSTKSMEKSPSWAHGHFYWNELMTHDVEGTKVFYTKTLGWTFDPMPMDHGTYWVIKVGGDMVGGLFDKSGPNFQGMPDQWISYIAVDDIEARFKKAVAAGAKVMREPFDIKGVGRAAFLREPNGAPICWITPKM
jgi:uncharacterized protein